MIVAIWCGVVLIYGLMGTAVGMRAYWLFLERRAATRDVETHAIDAEGEGEGAMLCGVFWPVAAWLVLGMVLVQRETMRRRRQASLNAERDRLVAAALKEFE